MSRAAVEASYAFCRRVARRRAKNFYYAFLLLDRTRRDAMCALYAFNRHCDDISDEPERFGHGSPREALGAWRRQLEVTLAGTPADHPIWLAFHDTVLRFRIPGAYFYDMIEGVMSDLEPRRIRTFDELYRYCYQVAAAVGLSVLYVFGFQSAEAPALAEKCGVAFQLTNILRDVQEDAARERIYLPEEDLARFGVDPGQLRRGPVTEPLRQLLRFEAERARRYYAEAARLVDLVDPRSRASLWALMRIYSRLLDRIEEAGFDVFSRRRRVPLWEKCAILLEAVAR
jgi:phytoene synthase